MDYFPCKNPSLCGVQNHRRVTLARCMNAPATKDAHSVTGGSVTLSASSSYEQEFIEISEPTRKVLDACVAAGGRPILVGGCVRDALWSQITGLPVDGKDVDVEVYGVSGAALWNSLSAIDGVHLDEDGSPMGVYKVNLDGEDFDVTLPRIDSKTGKGHNGFSVEINPELSHKEAFGRRDYTINSMGFDPRTGELIDPYNGQEDLEFGILRHTSDSFDEDPVRVLRGVQFIARYGFEFAPETVEKARSLVDTFHELKPENVWKQFYKLTTKGVDIAKGLDALHEVGWDVHFPGYAAVRDVPQDPRWHPEGSVGVHLGLAGNAAVQIADRDDLRGHDRALLVLAAITHDFGKATHTKFEDDGSITSHGHDDAGVEPVRQFLKQIGAPHSYALKILPIVQEHMCHSPNGDENGPTPTAVRRLIRRLDPANGGPTLLEWSRLVEADKGGRGEGALKGDVSNAHLWLEIAENLGGERNLNQTLFKGRHLRAEGYKDSAMFQFAVAMSIEAQDEGEFADEAGALAWFYANKERVIAEATKRGEEYEAEKLRIKLEKAAALKEQNRLIKIARREAREEAERSGTA